MCNAAGEIQRLVGGMGADIHVIRDDGTDFRNMPWGRDGNESCQGHQCWRGRTAWAITSTGTKQPSEQQLIESQAVPYTDHLGAAVAGRNPQSPQPEFSSRVSPTSRRILHGAHLITDTTAADQGGRVWVATLEQPGQDPLHPGLVLPLPVLPGRRTRISIHFFPLTARRLSSTPMNLAYCRLI